MFDNGDDDDDDVWFFNSIRTYKTLQMYELQIKPKRMVQINPKSLCLAGTHNAAKKTEIMCVELPAKLLLPPEEEGRCKGNDFQILSGGFFDSEVRQIGALLSQEKIVASFKGEKGLSVLALCSIKSNILQKSEILLNETSLEAPNFALNERCSQLLAAKATEDPLVLVDLNTRQVSQSVNIPKSFGGTAGEILCCLSSSYIALNSSTGCALALDPRTLDTNFRINKGGVSSQHTISADAEHRVCILSSSGICSVFDLRFNDRPLISGNFNFTCLPTENLKVTLSPKNQLLVSGVGNSIQIYDIDGCEFRHVFSHCGHSKLDSTQGCTVTDHIWLPSVSENFVVSCADNGTVNCWEYRPHKL